MVQLNFAKLQKLVCAHTVVLNLGVRTWISEHMQQMRDAHYELTVGLPRYMCSSCSNEIQLCC